MPASFCRQAQLGVGNPRIVRLPFYGREREGQLKQLLTEAEVEKEYTISKRTLQKLRCTGGGPSYLKLGRAVRYRPKDIEVYLESCIRASTSDDGTVQ